MNQQLGLRILSQIMKWDDDRARREFDWLCMMARWKYDGYRDFLAGARFIECLASWLQQFETEERETAYDFIRNELVYIGTPEVQRLVELFYPRNVEHRISTIVATKLGIPKYRIWSNQAAVAEYNQLKRKTLFMALSDGARIDALRHANVGVLSNEQLVIATQVDTDKWKDMLKKLRKETQDPTAQFALVFLIDDFMGTGTSFLRKEEGKWKGKLIRFCDSICSLTDSMDGASPFENNAELCIHHYIASNNATILLQDRITEAKPEIEASKLFNDIHISFGITLPQDLPLDFDTAKNKGFLELINKYYDPIIRTEHTDVGGTTHMGLGYGGCALPLVLEHNTPNNSVALLWAETDGDEQPDGTKIPAMRPLFRRRQRHS